MAIVGHDFVYEPSAVLVLCGCMGTELNILTSGGGMVAKNPDDQAVGYQENTVVTIEAIPAEGWKFSHWEGYLTGYTNPATVVVDSEKTIKAVFVFCKKHAFKDP